MEKITKETVLAEFEQQTRKTYFYDGVGKQIWWGLRTEKPRPTFTAYMNSSIKIFEAQTGLELEFESNYQGYWRYVNEEETAKIRDWMKSQGTLVFLRDCLSLSVALSNNFDKSGERTPIGQLQNEGKWKEDENSIRQLANMVEQQIRNLPYYKDGDLICSVPSPSDKGFDFPGKVASLVGEKVGKQNITGGFVFGGPKPSLKDVPFDKKWQVWEDAQVSFRSGDEFNIKDKTIILIDDLYQSGITIQYIAMKLQQAGAREVYGLSFVKTRGDKDNVSRNTNDE